LTCKIPLKTTIQKYSGMTGSVRSTILNGHKDCVISIAHDPVSGLLLSASEDHTARLWDIRAKHSAVRLFRIPNTDRDVGTCLKIGNLVTVSRGNAIYGFDTRLTNSVIVGGPSWTFTCTNRDDDINDYGVSPDGSTLAVPTDNGDIEILSLSSFERETKVSNAHTNIASVARYLPNKNNLVSGGYDCYINNYKIDGSQEYKLDKRISVSSLIPTCEDDSSTQQINPPFGACIEISDADNNSQIAVGSGDGSVMVLNTRRGKPDFRSSGWGGSNVHSTSVCGLCWSGDNQSVWSIGNDKVLVNMDQDRIRVRYCIGWKPNGVAALDGCKVAVCGNSTSIEILDFY
jgi:WD40 repeat protein